MLIIPFTGTETGTFSCASNTWRVRLGLSLSLSLSVYSITFYLYLRVHFFVFFFHSCIGIKSSIVFSLILAKIFTSLGWPCAVDSVTLLVLGHKGAQTAKLATLAVVIERHLEPLALGPAILEPELHVLALQARELLAVDEKGEKGKKKTKKIQLVNQA